MLNIFIQFLYGQTPVAKETGLKLALSETLKTSFCRIGPLTIRQCSQLI